jgi:hypothetical protein
METVVSTVVAEMPTGAIAVEHVDISTDARLNRLYGEEIPVLLIDGHKMAKYRITAEELRRRLERTDRSERSGRSDRSDRADRSERS